MNDQASSTDIHKHGIQAMITKRPGFETLGRKHETVHNCGWVTVTAGTQPMWWRGPSEELMCSSEAKDAGKIRNR